MYRLGIITDSFKLFLAPSNALDLSQLPKTLWRKSSKLVQSPYLLIVLNAIAR
jgi:hypothetical protein